MAKSTLEHNYVNISCKLCVRCFDNTYRSIFLVFALANLLLGLYCIFLKSHSLIWLRMFRAVLIFIFFVRFWFFLLQLIYNVLSISAIQQSDPVIYIYIYTHILFLTLSSIMFHHKWLDIVLCAVQQDLIAYPLRMQLFASTNPKLPVHPIPSLPQSVFLCVPKVIFLKYKSSCQSLA